jgi:hypothetical protein
LKVWIDQPNQNDSRSELLVHLLVNLLFAIGGRKDLHR